MTPLTFESLLNEVQTTTSKQSKSLTSHLYNAINATKNRSMPSSKVTELALNYQFANSRHFNHTNATDAKGVLSYFNNLVSQKQTPDVKKQVSDMFKNIERAKSRIPSAIKSALVRYEKRTTNVQYNTTDYELTSVLDGDNIKLVARK